MAKSAFPSPAFRQAQARQRRLRLPHTYFDSRLQGRGVVDDQTQLVFAGLKISRKIKRYQGIKLTR